MKQGARGSRPAGRDGRLAELGLLVVVASWGAAHGTCRAVGATYAPRSVQASSGIRYRMTMIPTPPDTVAVAKRYRFELFSRRSGRRISAHFSTMSAAWAARHARHGSPARTKKASSIRW
jgi:hypothetical protein